jgi:hypothetical protein
MARISRRHPSPARLVQEGSLLSSAIAAKADELAHLGFSTAKLQEQLKEVQELSARAAALQAERQEVSRQLQQALGGASKLITVLQLGVKEHYGSEAERLVEFGIKPFRGARRRKASGVEPGSPAEEPGASASVDD